MSNIEERQVVITRLLKAPRELVWTAWTDPKHVINWWGPNGFTNTIHEMDVKPGGVWSFIMHGPDGVNYPNRIVFEEVVKPERLTYSHGSDEENNPHSFSVTVTFAERGKETELTMRSLFKTKEARDFVVKNFGAVEGGNQTVSKLAAYLETMK